jgi:tRNA(fMet)-specific endonuclease VapC
MNHEPCLLDTDIVSYMLQKQSPVYEMSLKYLTVHGGFTISCLTHYECLRGLKAIGATKRLWEFQGFLTLTDIIDCEQGIIHIASDIYGELKKRGKLPGEFDILIAATALHEELTLVTNNEKHYRVIQEIVPLKIWNWNNSDLSLEVL